MDSFSPFVYIVWASFDVLGGVCGAGGGSGGYGDMVIRFIIIFFSIDMITGIIIIISSSGNSSSSSSQEVLSLHSQPDVYCTFVITERTT